MNPITIGAIVLIALLTLGIGVQTKRLESCKSDHAAFVATVKAEGEAAKAKADAQALEDKQRKEKADAKNRIAIAGYRNTIKQLRESANTSGGSMSSNPAGSRCPEGQVCYDKSEYQRADGIFVKGARGLADEGSQIAIDLSTAQEWANTR